jgi:hypothetical protein
VTQTVVPTEVADYLAAVREALGDLGAEERDDLLVEVEASLIETAGETGGLVARLGPAGDFAAELRASAGLPPAPAKPPETAPHSLLDAVRASVGQLAADPRVRAVGRVGDELAPLWWLARAYIGVIAVTRIAGAGWSFSHPAVTRFGSPHLIGPVLVAAAVGSIAVGLRHRRRRGRRVRRAAVAVNVALALVAVPVGIHLAAVATAPAPRDAEFVAIGQSTPGLNVDGRPITNIYPYTRGGRLLHDVLLFDGSGQPLDINKGDTDPTRQVLTAAGGQRIFDSFPIRYFDPGTGRVSKPDAAPTLLGPSLFTRPAARRPRR